MSAPAAPTLPAAAPASTSAPAQALSPAPAPALSRSGEHNWARTPERSNPLALRLMRWIALACGRRVARCVLHPITLYFLLFAPAPRRHARHYLARALGRPARWRDLYRHIFCFTATILDRVYLLGGCLSLFEVSVRGEPLIEATLSEGRGAFLVGAHLGSFEVLRAVGQTRAGLRIAMVMYPDNARLINQALRAIAPDFQPHIIALGRRDSMLAVRDWLDSGGLAGVLADRALAEASVRSGHISVPFLGREVQFSDGPFRLAALLRRRVIFMVGLYAGGNRYDVRFEALADFSVASGEAREREQRIHAAVLAYAALLEALCLESPFNWFNFHDFWGEESVS